MIHSPYVDKIVATGGAYLGKLILKAASKNLTPCILELGGKNPCIVDETVSIKNSCLKIS